MKIEDAEGSFIRYTSNLTVKDGNGGAWQGKVYGLNDDGEVHINGCWHVVSSVIILEEITYNN